LIKVTFKWWHDKNPWTGAGLPASACRREGLVPNIETDQVGRSKAEEIHFTIPSPKPASVEKKKASYRHPAII